MGFQARFLTENDYDNILCRWWSDWRWTPPSKDFLPDNGNGGVIVSKYGTDICAGYLYFTNSKAVWVEFVVSNINYKDKDRKQAIMFLVDTLTEYAKLNGAKYAYVSLKSQPLINKFIECGFQQGSVGCTELIKTL
jgi:hypothetical protein